MHRLDMPTILIINLITFLVCSVMIVMLWLQGRKRFSGLRLLSFDLICHSIAMFFFLLRGSIPDWASIIIPNSFIFAGSMLGYMGLLRFLGIRSSQIPNIITLMLFIFSLVYCTVLHQEVMPLRNLFVPIAFSIIWYQCFHLLIFRVSPSMRRITAGVAITFGGLLLVNSIRVIVFFLSSAAKQDFFTSGGFYQYIMVSYLIFYFLLTYSLSLMVNKRLYREIGIQEEKFSKAFFSSPHAIFLTRRDTGLIIEANDGLSELSGYTHDEIIGHTTTELRFWKDKSERENLMNELMLNGRILHKEVAARNKKGETIHGLFSADIITIEGHNYILNTFSDITKRKIMEEEIREMSLRDPMTGLYNRRGLFALADHELALSRREKKPLMVVFIDCDRLKQTNDNFGHEVGDRMITATAEVLRRTFRDSDIIARSGGDEFVIFCPDALPFAETMEERLKDQIAAVIRITPLPVPLSLSWGTSVYDPEEPCSLNELLAAADSQMYENKRSSRE